MSLRDELRIERFFSPDEPVGGGGSDATPSAPADAAPLFDKTDATSGLTDGSPAAVAPTTAAPSPAFSVRDHLKGRGFDTTRFKDDQQVTDYLAQVYAEMERARPYVELGQRYAPHASRLDEILRQQQPTQPAQAPKKWFSAPEWNQGWLNQVEQDDKGNLIPKAGYSPDVPAKIAAFRQHQREFFDKMATDPIGAIGPGIQEMVLPLVQQAIQAHLGQYSDQSYATELIRSNADWLYSRDAGGNFLSNPATGKRMLSPYGQAYQQNVNELAAAGVMDVRQQDFLARRMLAGQVAMQGGGQPASNDQLKQEFVGGAMRQPGRGGSVVPPANPNIPAPAQNGHLTLAEQMRANFKAAGINDEMLSQELMS